MQVWVITGDKQETAINIAIACKLIRQPDSLLICNENSPEAANARLEVLAEKLRSQYEPLSHHNPAPFAGTHLDSSLHNRDLPLSFCCDMVSSSVS